MAAPRCVFCVVVAIISVLHTFTVVPGQVMTVEEIHEYREQVRSMFQHAYDGYLQFAYPYDELQPLTCDGTDTWGSYSLTLIDALDTLLVMGNHSEFRRVAQLLADTMTFDTDVNASVFETNIRVVGGLLSAHLLSRRAGVDLEAGWPCDGPLLRLAQDAARRLLPAFDTPTGMPYGTVNLRYGVPPGETPVTCTAGVGTFLVEFGTLSRLTGDPVFEKTAMRALQALWDVRSDIGLVGNHIDVTTGRWTAIDAGIGAGVDSYFEYLVKGYILLGRPELMDMFKEYNKTINTYLKYDDWYMWANMKKGQVTMPVFQSLEAYWPGLQSLVGDVDSAMKSLHNYHQVWRQYGATPEFYNIPSSKAQEKREGYPLRPELVESAMYLYRATRDPFLLQLGRDVVEAINHITRTDCGYASIKDVRTHQLDNRMESFFLAETTKYLYLLFDPDNFIHNDGGHGDYVDTVNGRCVLDAGGYVFNTEAHPVDPAALYCCSTFKHDQEELQKLHASLDFGSLLDDLEDFSQDMGKKEDTPFLRTHSSMESTVDEMKAPDTRQGLQFDKWKRDKVTRSWNMEEKQAPAIFTCPAQPFYSRFSILGEMFEEK
ncbi:ER degradation-enhancing alpha-mannosidase-like protein 2 [Branchiostoma floridae]|uniref:alpha-1,2-Mannosidase n=1 Tax=Branchiostoma floridae TaxID=7739 RepID=A0A9J7LB50_BRAFL|nr:ER degradation-enhancing alpha-mannosidase-like protein 2 [Branchiostoma floridae]